MRSQGCYLKLIFWIGEGELKTELTSPNITIFLIASAYSLAKLQINPFTPFFMTSRLPITSLTKQIFLKYIASSNDIGNPSHNDGKIKKSNVASYDIVKNYNIDLMAQKYSEIYEDKRKEKNNYIKQI